MTTGLKPLGTGRPDPTWAMLFKAGGWSALLYVLLVLLPVVLVFAAPLPPTEGAALMEYIADHKVVYLAELVCFVGLAVPALVLFTALAVALKDVNKSVAAIGGLFGVASEVVALALGSSPQSLHGGLVVLSNAYRAAGGDADRADLVGAADALIAATNAVSWAGILPPPRSCCCPRSCARRRSSARSSEPSGWSPGRSGSSPRRCGR